MAYPTVSNTFQTNTTFIAANWNANYSDIIAGLSDGTKDLNLKNINATNLLASSTITISSNSTFLFTLTCNATMTASSITVTDLKPNLITLGSASHVTAATGILTVSQSFTTCTSASTINTITSNGFSNGDLLVLTKDATSGPVTFDLNGNLLLNASIRTLDSDYDTLTLQLKDGFWNELAFSNNA